MKNVLLDLDLDPRDVERLRALPGVTIHLSPTPSRELKDRALPPELLRGKQVLLCKRPPTNLADAVDLEMVHLATAGFEHLAGYNLYDSRIRVCNARGIFDSAIAEWGLAMMINLVRDVPGMFRNQQTKVWSRDGRFHQEIREKVLGIWGYGGIGRETARLAKACGMKIHTLTRTPIKPRLYDYTPEGTGDTQGTLPDKAFLPDQLNAFLEGVDFLLLCMPRTAKTTGMIGTAELGRMKSTAWLLNVARGPIVQEAALIDALKNKRIAGAALDVHYAYPLPPEHPLWEMENVILTPHISGSELSTLFTGRIGELYFQNLKRFLTGERMFNEITKDEWRETCGVENAVFGSGTQK